MAPRRSSGNCFLPDSEKVYKDAIAEVEIDVVEVFGSSLGEFMKVFYSCIIVS